MLLRARPRGLQERPRRRPPTTTAEGDHAGNRRGGVRGRIGGGDRGPSRRASRCVRGGPEELPEDLATTAQRAPRYLEDVFLRHQPLRHQAGVPRCAGPQRGPGCSSTARVQILIEGHCDERKHPRVQPSRSGERRAVRLRCGDYLISSASRPRPCGTISVRSRREAFELAAARESWKLKPARATS